MEKTKTFKKQEHKNSKYERNILTSRHRTNPGQVDMILKLINQTINFRYNSDQIFHDYCSSYFFFPRVEFMLNPEIKSRKHLFIYRYILKNH